MTLAFQSTLDNNLRQPIPLPRIAFEMLGARVPHEDALGAIGHGAAVAADAAMATPWT